MPSTDLNVCSIACRLRLQRTPGQVENQAETFGLLKQSRHGGDGLMFGLDDLSKSFPTSVIVRLSVYDCSENFEPRAAVCLAQVCDFRFYFPEWLDSLIPCGFLTLNTRSLPL